MLGLEPSINELLHVRERWATVTNQALREAHIEAHVDHRSLQAQGIDREPRPYIPKAAFEMERHGYRSGLADRLRAEYETRVVARLERSEVSRPAPQESHRDLPSAKRQTLEEIRREARENWLRMRQSPNQAQGEQALESSTSTKMNRHHDDDLAR